MDRKKRFDIFLNWKKRFFGRKVRMLYFEV